MARTGGYFPRIGDEELVVGALLGDLGAFDELVRRFRGAVLAVAEQTLGSREAARDVAQEAFLLAFKALPQLEEPANFAGWLCAITRHRARRVGALAARSVPTEQSDLDRLLLEQSEELAVHPEAELTRRALGAEVRGALARLPDELQEVLKLRYWEEWPVRRIADFLSLPVTTVKWRLHQGRKLLRRHLEPELERCHERGEGQPRRNPAHPPHAAADGANGARGEPDRGHGERRARLGAAI